MQIKSGAWAVKDLDDVKGTVECIFSTFNVRDHDGDVTLPGAFTEGQQCAISAYGHRIWDGAPPVGKGSITANTKEARFKGQFFMDIPEAKSTFLAVKGMGDLQEWSYGFDIADAEMGEKDGERVRFLKTISVYEVSPVLRGAGIRTRTTSAKNRTGEKGSAIVPPYVALPGHECRISHKSWTGPDYGNTAPDIAGLRAVHAAWDPTTDPADVKGYAFPHHERPGGPASARAVLFGVAQLLGAKGAPALDEKAREGVYAHLAGHLEDADLPVPALADSSDEGMKFYAHAAVVLADVHGVKTRAQEIMRLRAGRGKGMAAATVQLVDWLHDEMRDFRAMVDTPQEDAAREYLRYIRENPA